MSASAILSVTTGGALNGASAADTTAARASGGDAAVADAGFAALLDLKTADAPQTPIAPLTVATVATPQLDKIQTSETEDMDITTETGNGVLIVQVQPSLLHSLPTAPNATASSAAAMTDQQAGSAEADQTVPTLSPEPVADPETSTADTGTAPIAILAPVPDLGTTGSEVFPRDPLAGPHRFSAQNAQNTLNPLPTAASPVTQTGTPADATAADSADRAAQDQAVQEALRAATAARPEVPRQSASVTSSLPPQVPVRPQAGHPSDGNAAQAGSETLEGPASDMTAATTADAEPSITATRQPASTPAPVLEPAVMAADAGMEVAADAPDVNGERLSSAQAETGPQSRLSLANIRTTAELAAQFVTRLGQRVSRFDMVLTPETLGTVDVSMEVGKDGQLQARMVFDTPAAAQEMRARAEELRRQLAEAGFNLGENALEFTDRESQSRGGFQQFFSDDRPGRRAFDGANRLAQDADPISTPVWQSVSLTPRGVDMKV